MSVSNSAFGTSATGGGGAVSIPSIIVQKLQFCCADVLKAKESEVSSMWK